MRISILLLLLFSFTCQLSAQEEIGLKEQIENYFKSGRIGASPVVVINGDRVEGELPVLDASTSFRVTVMHKGEPRLIDKYGPAAKDGVVLVSTGKSAVEKRPDEDLLCLLNGEPVAREVLENLNPDMIAAMKVVKDPAEIAKFTDVPYNGIIMITLKD